MLRKAEGTEMVFPVYVFQTSSTHVCHSPDNIDQAGRSFLRCGSLSGYALMIHFLVFFANLASVLREITGLRALLLEAFGVDGTLTARADGKSNARECA